MSNLLEDVSGTACCRDRFTPVGHHSAPGRPRLPGWLVVGAASRKAGKTEFACDIIRQHSRRHSIVAVKVTVIDDGDSPCPRGSAGCGVCASLKGDFRIVEEKGDRPEKDTARMLVSGAARVFWITCRRSRIHEAIHALAPRIEPTAVVVAESNSLVTAFEPDVFLLVRDFRRPDVKPSAAQVLPLAHRVVASADGTFDLQSKQLAVHDGAWHLAEASAVILAGGRSSRMGRDKSLLPIEGRPLVAHIHAQLRPRFDDILVSTNDPSRYGFLGARAVGDVVPGLGPLMGIASAMRAARHDRLFVVACDIPCIDLDIVGRLLVLADDADCVVPLSATGHEPLFAVYRASALRAMVDALACGQRRISAIFPRVRTRFYPLGHAPWYRNLNTPAEMTAYLTVAT